MPYRKSDQGFLC